MSRLRAALLAHRATWRSLWQWVLRRPVPPGGSAFSYARALTPVLAIFIGLSVVEVVVVHVVLPWPRVRLAADVLGAYGLLWMVGMLAGMRMHPHTVDDAGLHVRSGATVRLSVPWEEIASVRSRPQAVTGMRTVQVAAGSPASASLPVAGQTNVEVRLRAPSPVLASRGDRRPVAVVRLFADELRDLVARLRERSAGRPPTSAAEETAR